MKTIILAVLMIVASLGANAQDRSAEQPSSECIFIGSAYSFAASLRNQGLNPEEALRIMSSGKNLSDRQYKAIINQTYFDPAFAHAGGYALNHQMTMLCAYGPDPKMKPLK